MVGTFRRPARIVALGLWLVFGTVAGASGYLTVSHAQSDRLFDLDVYQISERHLAHGLSLYTTTKPFFTYPPFAGLALFPIEAVDPRLLGVLWTLALVVAIVGLAWVVATTSRFPPLAVADPVLGSAVVACLLLVSAPVRSNIYYGQISLFITVMAVLDATDVVPRRYRGVLTGVAAAVKLTPLIFIPYLWLTGRVRAAVVAAATFVGCGLVGLLVLPRDSALFWTSRVVTTKYIGGYAEPGNESIAGFLARAGVGGAPRTVLLVAGSVTLVVLGYRRARTAYLAGDPLAGAVIVGAVAVAVTPISWMHHQVLLVVAAACTVDAGRRLQWLWPALVLGVMLLPQVQSTVDSLVPAGALATDDLQFVLAVAIAACVPFRYPANQRAHVRDTLTVAV